METQLKTALDSAKHTYSTNSSLRWGQCVWNALVDELGSEIMNKYRGSIFDCFYNDSKVDGLIFTIEKDLKQ